MEFESGPCNLAFLGSCKFKKQLFVISIFSGCRLVDIFASLGKNCPEFTPKSIILQYIAPRHKMYVFFNEDDDVLDMIHLHMCMKLSMIHLRAMIKDEVVGNANLVRVDVEDTQSRTGNDAEQGQLSNTLDAWINCINGKGQTFKDAAEFRRYLKNYSVASVHLYIERMIGKMLLLFVVKRVVDEEFILLNIKQTIYLGSENVICSIHVMTTSREHPKADATWIANVVKDKLIGEPSYRLCTIQKDLHRDYGIELDYHKVWKGKELTMHDIHGTDKGCYDRLRWYCHAVRQTNPGSVAECDIDLVTQKIKRIFIFFHACAVGFVTGCRPLIF